MAKRTKFEEMERIRVIGAILDKHEVTTEIFDNMVKEQESFREGSN